MMDRIVGIFWGIRQERKKERERRLKVHFEEVKREAETGIIPGISGVFVHYGRVTICITPNPYKILTELPKPSDSFAAHFPEQTAELAGYEPNIIKHNKAYEAFRLKITKTFKSSGLDVVSANTKVSLPHIWDNIFWLLFEWWLERNQGKAPRFDFQRIETETRQDSRPHNLYVAGCDTQSVACAETEEGEESCRSAIWEVAGNKEYEREAIEIISSANELAKKVATFNNELTDKLSKIDKFKLWRGRHREFTRQNQCPDCKKYI